MMSDKNASFNISNHENCSSLTRAQQIAQNGPVIILASFIMTIQLLNIVVFCRWRNKEPFVLFHVSLAVISFLMGASSFLAIFARFFSYLSDFTVQFTKLGMFLFTLFQLLFLLNLLVISIDRWLSVEFPVPYRNRITRKKVLWTMSATLAVAVVMMTIGGVELWRNLVVSCAIPGHLTSHLSKIFYVWIFLTEPLPLILLLLWQTRIFFIALSVKLRSMLSRERVGPPGSVPPDGPQLRGGDTRTRRRVAVQLAWSSLRASMVVLLSSALFSLYNLLGEDTIARYPLLQQIIRVSTALQYTYEPVVYLCFFPEYRAVVPRFCTGWVPSQLQQHSSRIGRSRASNCTGPVWI